MSEPVILSPEGCAPCRDHDTLPTVIYYGWRSPSYQVACGYTHAASDKVYAYTLEEAREAWNAQHPQRSIAPETPMAQLPLLAKTEEELAPHLTTEFLSLLVSAVRVYGSYSGYGALQEFVHWCLALHGQYDTVDLSPLAIEEVTHG